MREDGKPQQQIQRVERARRVVSHCSQAAIRAYDEVALLSEACRHLVDVGDYCMAWFAEAKPGEDDLLTLAHASSAVSGVRDGQVPWTDKIGPRTPTLRALLEQRPHVVRGIPSSPILQQRHPEAASLGYASMSAFPIQFGPHGAGVLTIYAREPDAFGPEEVSLLRELAGDMAVGVSGLRARKANDLLEEKLEIAEQRYRSIVEHAPVGILQVDPDGHVILANRALAALLGYGSVEEVMALPPDELASRVDPLDFDNMRPGGPGIANAPREVEIIRADGKRGWAQVIVRRANGGSVGAVEAFVRDISAEHAMKGVQAAEARQRQETLRLTELDRLRADFIGRASHELNTPLTPILLQVQAMQGAGLDDKQARGLALIERNVLRLAALVKDLLVASTIESREFPADPQPFDLSEKAGGVVTSLQAQAEAAGVALSLDSEGKVEAFADCKRILQVVYNLIGNALKFTPSGGSVTVRCRPERGAATLTVADSGHGFDPGNQDRLFEPFGRLHEHVAGAPGGTGLGLFISKAIIDQSGGTLWGKSEGPGKGATFGFTIPTEPPERPPVEPGRGIVKAEGFEQSGEPVADGEPEPGMPDLPSPQALTRTRIR
ncbi:MAG: ATP-binding protein [Thermoplasmatota archaeon]